MPFGAIKDLMERGGRKTAKASKRAGKKAYGAAKDFDEGMKDRHGGRDSPGEAFGIDSGDGGGRYESDPSFPFGGGNDTPDQTVLGAGDFDGGPDIDLGIDRDDAPRVTDAMGDNDDTDRFW